MLNGRKISRPTTGSEYEIGYAPGSYGRREHAYFSYCKCDLTGNISLCVAVDTSQGEYGPMFISLAYLNQLAERRGLSKRTAEQHREAHGTERYPEFEEN